MPIPETLERFIARVEANAHMEAVEEFYTEDSSMQENQSPPRLGRDAHAANERRVMSRVKTLTSTCVRPVFLNGDRVVIRWIFRFEWLDGTVTHMEELANFSLYCRNGQKRPGRDMHGSPHFQFGCSRSLPASLGCLRCEKTKWL